MRTLRLVAGLLIALAAPLRAQGNTQEALDRAVSHFENLDVERSLTLLRQIISPASPYEVTREQRVVAYKYTGAALALVGMRDSAIVYFRAALERDAFTDLDPERFTEIEREAFTEARNQFLALGTRPIRESWIDPATVRITLTFVTTHAAHMRVELREVRTDHRTLLFEGPSDGMREITWSGLDDAGRIVPPGRYEVVYLATSRRTGRADSTRLYIDVQHDREALEDTLASFRPEELLPERHPPSAAPLELAKGLGLAASALILPSIVGNSSLDGDRKLVASVAGAAAVTGVVASVIRHRNRELPANVAANRARLADRDAANAAIRQRNSVRLAATRLRIAPAAGITQ